MTPDQPSPHSADRNGHSPDLRLLRRADSSLPLGDRIADALDHDPQAAFALCEQGLRSGDPDRVVSAARSLKPVCEQYPYEGATLTRALLERGVITDLDRAQTDEVNRILEETVERMIHSDDPKIRAHVRDSLDGHASYVLGD